MKTLPGRIPVLALCALLLAGCGREETTVPEAPLAQESAARADEQPEATVQVDREKAAALGVTVNQVVAAVGEAYGGKPIPGDADLTKLTVRSVSGDLVPLSSVATISLGAESSEIQKADAAFLNELKSAPDAAQRAGATDEGAAYDAWFKNYQIDPNDPAMLAADPDSDGVSNRDEFLAGTNPRDAASRPDVAKAHPAMRFKAYNEVRLPLVLESVSGEKAVIRHGDGSETVRVGDRIRGFPWRVVKVSERRTTDKEGAATDRSQVVLEDTARRDRVTLVKALPAKSPATHAVLSSADGITSVKVHAGEVFSWPGEPGTTYRVLDLASDQIVIQQQETRKMWTLPRR